MKLVNMAMSSEEAKEQYGESMIGDPNKAPLYPYGLALTLDEEAIAKLGLSKMPDIGEVFMIQALVKVCAASERQDQGGDIEQSLSMQITDMALGPQIKQDDSEKPDPGSKLYGGGDGSGL